MFQAPPFMCTPCISIPTAQAEGNTKLLEKLTKVMAAIDKEESAARAAAERQSAQAAQRARAPSYADEGGRDWDGEEGDTASTGGVGAWARSFATSLFSGGAGAAAPDAVPHLGAAPDSGVASGAPKHWLPDHLVKACMMCGVGFGILVRKHHCRACGAIYCAECSSHRVEAERICDMCYERAYDLRTKRLAGILGDDTPLPPRGVSLVKQPEKKRKAAKGGRAVPAAVSPPATGVAHLPGPGSAALSMGGSSGGVDATKAAYSNRYGGVPPGSATGSPSAGRSQSTSALTHSQSMSQLQSSKAPSARHLAASPEQRPASESGKDSPLAGEEYPVQAADGGVEHSPAVHSAGQGAPPATRRGGHGAQAAVAINDRVMELESALKRLRSEVHVTTQADALPHEPFAVLMRSELLSALLMPVLYLVARLGWWAAPVFGWGVAFMVALLGVGSHWTLGGTMSQYMYTALDAPFAVVTWPLETFVGPLPIVGAGANALAAALRPSFVAWCMGMNREGGWTAVFVWCWVLLPAALAYAGNSNSDAAQLFRRRMRVYGLGASVFFDYKLTEWFTSAGARGMRDGEEAAGGAMGGLEAQQHALVWQALHRRNSQRVMQLMLDLRGLWVKAGQYLSSRPDVMPDEYIDLMSSLQDGMPARPLREVQSVIEDDMGQPVEKIFQSIDERALAAASVGQVHRGTLADGSQVAIKVQHKGMGTILRQDLENLGTMLSILSWAAPDFDLKSIMTEWSKEVGSELDFRNEARNTERVRRNMAMAKMPVTLPRVIEGLVGDKVMVMRFVPGVRASDRVALLEAGVNLEKFVHDICTAYAHQIYVDGFFNGDPHPGNIMAIQRGTLRKGEPQYAQWLAAEKQGRGDSVGILDGVDMLYPHKTGSDRDWLPVLLDFGLTKTLPPSVRLAFGKLVVAGEEMDYGMLLEAFDEMGMKFSSESAGQDMENLQHMFRDALPADEARAAAAKRDSDKTAKQAADKARTEAAAQRKRDRSAARATAASAGGAAAAAAAGEDSDSDEEEERKLDAWPSELMFFLRASELLQGLASQLRVRYSFMGTMAAAARNGLRMRVPTAAHARTMVYPPAPPLTTLDARAELMAPRDAPGQVQGNEPGDLPHTPLPYGELLCALPPPMAPPSRPWARVETLVADVLGQWIHAGGVQGMQVAVFWGNTCLVDVAAGTLGPLDARPVTPASLFPVYGAGRLAVATAAQSMLTQGTLADLETHVSDKWEGFGAHGKSGCSVQELLACRSGVEYAAAKAISTRGLAVESFATAAAEVAAVRPMLLRSFASPPLAAKGAVDAGQAAVVRLLGPRADLRGDAPHGYQWRDCDYDVDDDDAAMNGLPPLDMGLPSGPNRRQETVSHLYFGWGWAVAGWMASMGGATMPAPGTPAKKPKKGAAPDMGPARALAKVFREHVRGSFDLGAEVVLGTIAEHEEEEPRVLLDALPGPKGETAMEDFKKFACALTQRRPTANTAGEVGVAADAALRLSHVALSVDVDLDDPERGSSSSGGDSGGGGGGTAGTLSLSAAVGGEGGGDEEGQAGNTTTMGAALAAMELVGSMEKGLEDLEDLCSGGKEHIMDPRIVNARLVQRCPLPSLNVRASARALAKAAAKLSMQLAEGRGAARELQRAPGVAMQAPVQGGRTGRTTGAAVAECDMLLTVRRVYDTRQDAATVGVSLRSAAAAGPGGVVDVVGPSVLTYGRIARGSPLPCAGEVTPAQVASLDTLSPPSTSPAPVTVRLTLAPLATVAACSRLGLRPILLDADAGPVEGLGSVGAEHPMLKANTSANKGPVVTAPSAVSMGFGTFGLGGTLVFVDPANEHLSVAITTSQLCGSRQTSLRMTALLARALGIRVPKELTGQL